MCFGEKERFYSGTKEWKSWSFAGKSTAPLQETEGLQAGQDKEGEEQLMKGRNVRVFSGIDRGLPGTWWGLQSWWQVALFSLEGEEARQV